MKFLRRGSDISELMDFIVMMISGKLGNIKVGDKHPVALMGVINLSPDSFFKSSIFSPSEAVKRATEMAEGGAQILDIGAMGTGPKSAPVDEKVEIMRLVPAIRAISREVDIPVSVDTQRAKVAEEAIAAGAEIINDVSGMKHDPGMGAVVKRYNCSVVMMAADKAPGDVYTIPAIKKSLMESLKICGRAGIDIRRVVVDPGVGFWPGRLKRLGKKAETHVGRYRYPALLDLAIISKLKELRKLGRPICVGISRKSFIGEICGERDPAKRLPGSLAATAVAVINGAHVIRTHDPAETSQAVKVAEALRIVGEIKG
ncbi:MAG: dihydropteroate synthase [Candidatus Hadarchaeales archaeon]